MAIDRHIAAELIRAFVVLALVFLSFGHQPAAAIPPGHDVLTAAVTANFCGDSPADTTHAPPQSPHDPRPWSLAACYGLRRCTSRTHDVTHRRRRATGHAPRDLGCHGPDRAVCGDGRRGTFAAITGHPFARASSSMGR